MRMWEGGLELYWNNVFTRHPGHPCHVTQPPNSKKIITLVDFSGVFLLLATGMVLSFFVFILEQIVFNGMKKRNKYQSIEIAC